MKFIRLIDRLFDVLNSRNPFGKGFKSALRINNKMAWHPFLTEAYSYIFGLKDSTGGSPMYRTRRKTGFVGFLVAIQSVKAIFHELVELPQAPLKYLLTYKFSQDHLELFFGAVRSAGGFNNNPTAQQFVAAYKRLLLRSSVEGGQGNCKKLEQVDILHVIGDTCRIDQQIVSITSAALIRKYDMVERQPNQSDHDYADAPNVANLSEFKVAAISYISGYVAKMANKKIMCMSCSKALGNPKPLMKDTSSFLVFKDRGGLFNPSSSGEGFPDAVAISVLAASNLSTIFKDLESHMLESAVGDNHVFSLIKIIAKCYCKVRLYHLGKEATINITGVNIRKKLNKLVLFKHQ